MTTCLVDQDEAAEASRLIRQAEIRRRHRRLKKLAVSPEQQPPQIVVELDCSSQISEVVINLPDEEKEVKKDG
jgi:hypothetical protein